MHPPKGIEVPLLFFTLLLFSACGIESYPYLFPPERISGADIDFRHDERNDPSVFRGYEFYYRIYPDGEVAPTGTIEDEIIISDMNAYFNGTSDFIAVSSNSVVDSSGDQGYRRFYVSSTHAGTRPLVPIDSADVDTSFTGRITETDGNLELEISTILASPLTFKRTTEKTSPDPDFPPFSTILSDYEETDDDILFNPQDPALYYVSPRIAIAVFAVPFGFDSMSFTQIYANGTSADMTYLGSFLLNLN
jgi:hypothetical protein